MTAITACVTVWTLTTDGDNMPIETRVFPSEALARQNVVALLNDSDRPRRHHFRPTDRCTNDQLAKLWAESFDGACIIEAHTLSAPLTTRSNAP